LALLLAVIGLYGVMSYAVSQSTRELGLRMALGAGGSHLLRLVMSRGLALTAGGVLLGAAVSLALTRLLGKPPVQSESPRPAGLRLRIRGDDHRLPGSVFLAGLACHAHRSSPRIAD